MADNPQKRRSSQGSAPSGARPAAAGSKPASGARPAAAGRATRPGLGRRVATLLAIIVLALALIGSLGVVVFYNATSLPDPNKDFTTNTTFLYYNDGKTKLGSFAVQNRQSLTYAQMPEDVKNAVVAAENRTFWTDRGISPSGIVRSVWTIARGGEVQGGSTITQQYIKILYLSSDRSLSRKFRELALAVKMGKQLSKEQILQGYLNTIYFGRGAYGVQAASRAYFNVDAKALTIPQAAVLASVLNNPSIYDPSVAAGNKARLLDRYHYVLDGMQEAGKITKAQHDAAYKALPAFPDIPLSQRWSGTNGYLMRMVENELLANGLTQSQIEGGGLQITTTFDKTLEDRAIKVGQYYKKIVGENAGNSGANLHPSIASVEVGTGKVLAIYGGDDYLKNTRNWATTARPAASTFKAWATVAGLRSGFSLNSRFDGNTFTPTGDTTSIRNENGYQYGSVSLRKALTDSINTAFVDMTDQMSNGPKKIIQAANDAGLPTAAGWDAGNRIALGIAEVSPLSNATGYATLANGGNRVTSHVVTQVKNSAGKVIYTGPTTGKQTIDKGVAGDVVSALTSVVQEGTGTRVSNLGFEVAGKTGTNGVERNGQNIINSAWFVGTTPEISTAALFVAGNDGNGSLDSYKRYSDTAFFGGTYPAMMWASYMKVAMEGRNGDRSFPERGYVNGGYSSSSDSTQDSSNQGYTNQGTSTQGGWTSGSQSASTSQQSATAQSSSSSGQATSGSTGQATSGSTSQATSGSTSRATSGSTSRATSGSTGQGTSGGSTSRATSGSGNGTSGTGTSTANGNSNGTGSGGSTGGTTRGGSVTTQQAQPTANASR